jgi:hypothetical protein
MAERDIERRHRKAVKRRGGTAYKFVSPGRRGVPDRLVLFPRDRAAEYLRTLINAHVRHSVPICADEAAAQVSAILERCVRFAELKNVGKRPEKHQLREHLRLRDMGFRVDVPASIEAAEAAAE